MLCEELLVQILSWLPVKSLVRFKSVSKSWNSLISDSRFVKLHLHRSSSSTINADFVNARFLTSCNILYSDQSYVSSRSMSSLLETHSATAATSPRCHSGYKFIGACNGLVCLSFCNAKNRKGFSRRVRFWNPATRLMSQPSPPLAGNGCFGFGYDSSSDTYKVVNVFPEETMVNVFNMGEKRWRRTQVFPLPCLNLIQPAHYVSNNLIWLATLRIDYYWKISIEPMDTDWYRIVSFDLGKQKYAQLALPYSPRRDQLLYFLPILGVLRGCLCISENHTETGNFVVWQMKEFGVHESWTQLFSIKGSENIIEWPCFAMCISDNCDALLLLVSGVYQGLLYTFRDNKLDEGTKIAKEIGGVYAENYIESLVSPR